MSQRTSVILPRRSHRAHAIAIRATFLGLVMTLALLIGLSLGMLAGDPASGISPRLSAGHSAAVVLVQLWLLSLAVGLAAVTLRIYRRMA